MAEGAQGIRILWDLPMLVAFILTLEQVECMFSSAIV